jgi:hypothetical protein
MDRTDPSANSVRFIFALRHRIRSPHPMWPSAPNLPRLAKTYQDAAMVKSGPWHWIIHYRKINNVHVTTTECISIGMRLGPFRKSEISELLGAISPGNQSGPCAYGSKYSDRTTPLVVAFLRRIVEHCQPQLLRIGHISSRELTLS